MSRVDRGNEKVYCIRSQKDGIKKPPAMKPSGKFNREARDAEKRASRRADEERIKAGEDPAVLQRENSIFPEGFFKNARISNLKQAIGR